MPGIFSGMNNNPHNAVTGARCGPATAKRNGRAVAVEPVASLMLNVKEVAALLGIGTRTVWRLVDRDELPAPVAIGGRRLWHRPTLETFIKAKADAALNGTGECRP